MKIGFTGASGTGKTTLARALSDKYNLKLITDIARTSPGARFNMLTSNSQKSNQFIILNTLQFWAEQENIVSDRTVLDAYLYTKDLTSIEYNFAQSILEKNLKLYNLIIYCPYYKWDVKDEGVRNLDPKYQYDFCYRTQKHLDWHNIDYLTMKNVSIDERMNEIEQGLIFRNLI